MNFDDYQTQALQFAFDTCTDTYAALGLCGEAGEVAELFKKRIRGDNNPAFINLLRAEIGDVLWYLTAIAEKNGLTLSECARYNITKLTSRQQRGVLKGSGDNR